MAFLKQMVNKSYSDDEAIQDLVNYAAKMKNLSMVGGYGFTKLEMAAKQLQRVNETYEKENGRHIRHFILSFSEKEYVTKEIAMQIGWKVAQYYAERYQIVFGLHVDTGYPHLHFVMSTVDYNTGLKFTGDYGEFHRFKQYVAQVLNEYGFTLYEK